MAGLFLLWAVFMFLRLIIGGYALVFIVLSAAMVLLFYALLKESIKELKEGEAL